MHRHTLGSHVRFACIGFGVQCTPYGPIGWKHLKTLAPMRPIANIHSQPLAHTTVSPHTQTQFVLVAIQICCNLTSMHSKVCAHFKSSWRPLLDVGVRSTGFASDHSYNVLFVCVSHSDTIIPVTSTHIHSCLFASASQAIVVGPDHRAGNVHSLVSCGILSMELCSRWPLPFCISRLLFCHCAFRLCSFMCQQHGLCCVEELCPIIWSHVISVSGAEKYCFTP